MGSVFIIVLLQNVFIFSFIFWVLTWAGEYFLKKKNHSEKKNFYECGFKSTTDINIQINLNFSMLCVFLILYDIEFTILIPLIVNLSFIANGAYVVFLIFILVIITSLIYDWQMNSLNWQY